MCEFFKKTVRETIEYRERNGIKRKDFMDLMVELKNKGYVEDPDADQANKEGTQVHQAKILLTSFTFIFVCF